MDVLGDKITSKSADKFECSICDFKCCKTGDYKRHIMTSKHKKLTLANSLGDDENINNLFTCTNCNKNYYSRNGLWKHNKICNSTQTSDEKESFKTDESSEIQELKEFMKYLMKENADMKNMMMEVIKNGTHNTTTTNSHNKAFNLQFFLNETCKNAMNITDFVESIQLQLSDLEKVGEIGYVEGISNIIVKNLNALDVTQRPLHCTDKKRETIYIKDENKWEKDEEKNKIRKVIKKVATKNARLIQKFKEKHPDYNEYHSKYSTQYHKLIIESFGGSGDNDLEKEDKIIRNIAKNIVVDKEP
jgi:Txe/YoeB family toxin of Txe-Axe toxin-antitoxin module